MTRRALRPITSAAGAAPVISKALGLPCGAFGSITVLISSLLAFPALVGGARHVLLQRSKKLRRSLRAVSLWLGYFVVGLAGRRKGSRTVWAERPLGTRNRLVPNGAKNTPDEFACQEYSTIYWVSLFDCSQ